jgi:hypothetical protein
MAQPNHDAVPRAVSAAMEGARLLVAVLGFRYHVP